VDKTMYILCKKKPNNNQVIIQWFIVYFMN